MVAIEVYSLHYLLPRCPVYRCVVYLKMISSLIGCIQMFGYRGSTILQTAFILIKAVTFCWTFMGSSKNNVIFQGWLASKVVFTAMTNY